MILGRGENIYTRAREYPRQMNSNRKGLARECVSSNKEGCWNVTALMYSKIVKDLVTIQTL